ncbi:MAG: ribosome biogenesis GTPase Der [Selenomonadaceae bacterium]|uniref:GTPase Der n=1 Tax=Anaerovibrio slackiae TaxID=2652309 RepID=A0A6I2UJM8_9FIRM|nr:ribosome biogenesis GTPase Der [Anaerovibrio slackiae]MBQ2010696.1 ribosome biogenesis GTPase Der [Selenomonadaceae bacterium]MBQ5586912.1 ribosome biogenesis GTPase Der [Selenomonadaceae bacterium]MBQ5650740.1 ribosome biogenesis GTPase Der [Selenomonadaceae bacterium]MBQ5733538.1 ribosome biogenesis GTPase Der [Selenomonadaceae bacterium]MBQ5846511.1 ribosome biogenesis GTPase Der [Selenomonadaceae bacterium]
MSKPIVAIVGRPNVGKSTLFNQIGKRRVSIVDDMPGVTRDRIYMDAEWLNHTFTMIDTGGIEFEDDDHILKSMRQQALVAMEEADVIVFVVDGRAGLTTADEEVGRMLRNTKKPVILAVNKIDSPQLEAGVYEFYSLGLGEPLGIAASNSLGLGDLLDAVVAAFPENDGEDKEEDEISIAVIGRPNVGKSSIVNALIGENRVIVSNVPGTTRDAIDTHFVSDNIKFMLIDTAGMRRKGKIDEAIERYSVMRSLRAVDRADVVLMVINAEEGITEQDKKIAGYAHESGKGVIIVVNKWDVFPDKDDKSTLRFTEDLRDEIGFLQYAPVLYTSALTGQRIHRITELVKYVADQQSMRIQTSVLNELIRDAVSVNPPPSHRGKQLKIFFMTQADIQPPKFIIFVNDPELMHFSYLRFLENRLRESFGFEGTPLKLIVRGRKEEEDY